MLSQLLEPITLLASQQSPHWTEPIQSLFLCVLSGQRSTSASATRKCQPRSCHGFVVPASWDCSALLRALPCACLPCHGTVVDLYLSRVPAVHTPSTPKRPLGSSLLPNSGWPSSHHLRCPPPSYFASVSVALPPRSSFLCHLLSPAALLS